MLEDIAHSENFDSLLKQYVELTDKYVQTPLPQQAFEVKSDLDKILKLKQEIYKAKPHHQLIPSPIQIFLTQKSLLRCLSINNLKQLCLLNNEPVEEAITAFSSLEQNRTFIEGLLIRLTQKASCDDLALAQFLLSVPHHADFFNWQEVLNFFKTNLVYALKLACTHQTYQEQYIKKLDDKKAELLIASSALSENDLNKLLPKLEDKNTFLQIFYDNNFLNFFTKLSTTLLNWIFKQLTQNNEILNLPSILNNIIQPLANIDLMLVFEQMKNPQLLKLIEEANIIAFFKNPTLSIEAKQEYIQQFIEDQQDFLTQIQAPLTTTLCQIASAEQFSQLMQFKNIKLNLKNGIDPLLGKSCAYVLFSTIKEADKKDRLLNQHFEVLYSLTASEVLELAYNHNNNYPFTLATDSVSTLLNHPIFWQNHNQEQQRNINISQLMEIKEPALVTAFIKHNAYKESWLRHVINNEKWKNKGIGFFGKKTPTTIIKARRFLQEKGSETLEAEDLQELINLFKNAKQTSHTYSYLFGAFNLRDPSTQQFYDEVAKLPDAIRELETMSSMA